jgi:hypothetical protein
MATNRSNENVVYQNALLSVVVSSKHKGSQSFMSKTIGVSRYSLKKAIVRRVHVDQIGENIWGGASSKMAMWCAWWKGLQPHQGLMGYNNNNLTE